MESIPQDDRFSYSILVNLMHDGECWAQHSPKQESCIILVLLSMIIFTDLGNHCHFHYIVNLVDQNSMRNLNCEVPTYSTLIHGMRLRVRRTEKTHKEECTGITLGDLWRVIEVMNFPPFIPHF